MANRRTCLSCNAICCHKIVGYRYTPEAKAEHELSAKISASKGESYYSKKGLMAWSHRELLGYGIVEIALPDKGEKCKHLTIENKCAIQHHKPKLCRSYWCHGRLWKPKLNLMGG